MIRYYIRNYITCVYIKWLDTFYRHLRNWCFYSYFFSFFRFCVFLSCLKIIESIFCHIKSDVEYSGKFLLFNFKLWIFPLYSSHFSVESVCSLINFMQSFDFLKKQFSVIIDYIYNSFLEVIH